MIIERGYTPETALDRIERAYGSGTTVTAVIDRMKKEDLKERGGHPLLR